MQVLTPSSLPFDRDTVAPMGCLPGDLDEDGQMDLLVYYWGRTPVAFLKEGDSYQATEVAARVEPWFTNAATMADLNGDGHADLVVANYFQDGANILDASAAAPAEMHHSMSRAYNGGGTHIFLWQRPDAGSKRVSFEEVQGILPDEANFAWTLAVGAADLDGDLLPELYFANDFGPDRLLHNRSTVDTLKFEMLRGQRQFTTAASKVVGRDSFKGMGVDFADVNGDGWLDLYVSNIAADYALHESHFLFVSTGDVDQMQSGIAPYVDRSENLGLSRSDWSWDSRLGDLDNDGVYEALQATGFLKGDVDRWPELQELAMGNDEFLRNPRFWPRFQVGDDLSGDAHNRFYVLADDGRYYDIAFEIGLGRAQVTRGIATADVDGDGDLDFAVANQWDQSYFYRNDCPDCGEFIGLHLRFPVDDAVTDPVVVYDNHPVGPSRPAIGASVSIALPDGRTLVGQVDGGNGHSGKRSHDLHFGLGQQPGSAIFDVELRWRDGNGSARRQVVKLSPGWHTIELTTGTDRWASVGNNDD